MVAGSVYSCQLTGSVPATPVHSALRRATSLLLRLLRFVWAVVTQFVRNRGLLLASAIAHNTLLALVPMTALVLVGVSYVIDASELQAQLAARVSSLLPGGSIALTNILSAFLENRGVVGVTTVVMLGMIGVMGIRVVSQALEAIFGQWHWPTTSTWRRLMVELLSALLVAFALVALCGTAVLLEQLSRLQMEWIGLPISASDAALLGLGAHGGIALLVSALYWLLAPARIRLRAALAGGIFVSVAWQIVENILEWFFDNYSYVGVLYGSLAGLVIVMVSMELAAVLFLLGAQGVALVEGENQKRPLALSPLSQRQNDEDPDSSADAKAA